MVQDKSEIVQQGSYAITDDSRNSRRRQCS